MTISSISGQEKAVSPQEIAERRIEHTVRTRTKIAFRIAGLYGLCPQGIRMPLNEHESIDSGPICVTLDTEADPASNIGMLDFEKGSLTVRYGIQAVFPGLFELVTSGRFDTTLLNPVRGVATDECTLTDDHSGWRALGCLELLPGSVWAGAAGG
jgi:hypothetical protein